MIRRKNILPSLIFCSVASFLSANCLPGLQPSLRAEQRSGEKETFRMAIESVTRSDRLISITTTGARFAILPEGTLQCSQRIPLEREVLRISLPKDIFPLEIAASDDFKVVLNGNGIKLTFQGDSLIIMEINQDFPVIFHGLFKPGYQAGNEGKQLFIDQSGGFGIYPVQKKQIGKPDFNVLPWSLPYELSRGDEVWVSIFPPRPYSRARASELISDVGRDRKGYPYPTNEYIQSAAQQAKIFKIHSYFWKGGEKEPWLIAKFVPTDMKEFNRVRDEVHRNGMKFIVYFSPYYYSGIDYFDEMQRVLREYKVDGFYIDGISFDFRKSYHTIRRARQILGENNILYVHCSSDPFNSVTLYAPFIDTYADYILRGEAGRPGDMELKDFLRWTVSGYNISNAVGYWHYCASAVAGQPAYKYIVPNSSEIDTSLENHVYLCWSWGLYKESSKAELEKFRNEYFKKFKHNFE